MIGFIKEIKEFYIIIIIIDIKYEVYWYFFDFRDLDYDNINNIYFRLFSKVLFLFLWV